MSEIKGIIFDLGGVIAPYGMLEREAEFISNEFGVPKEDAIKAIKDSNYNLPELGREDSFAFWRRVYAQLGINASDEDVRASLQSWADRVAIISGPMLALVDELRESYKIGLLSNTSVEYTSAVKDRGFWAHFDDAVFSYKVGLRKPDPAIYRLAAERLGFPPEQLVFVDDLPANIEGAREVGMRGIVFENIGQLKEALKELGIIV